MAGVVAVGETRPNAKKTPSKVRLLELAPSSDGPVIKRSVKGV
jgi:hypothetical protein